MWLNVLTMLRRGRIGAAVEPMRPMARLALLALLAFLTVGNAMAGAISFDGGTVSNCKRTGKTYTCSSIPLVNYDDIAVIATGYTVVVEGGFAPGYNQGLSMSGSAALQTTNGGNVDLSASNNINISGGSLAIGGSFTPVAAGKTITANISAGSISTSGEGLTINGTVSASGAINFGNKVTVNGAVSAATITTGGEYTKINGAVTVTGAINFGSSTTVTGAVSGASISTGSATTISSSLTVTGLADLGSDIKIGGDLSANAVKTGSPAQISGAIDSKTTVDLGSGTTVGGSIKGTTVSTASPVTLNGAIDASVSFTLASGSKVTGNITSPSVTLNSSNSTVTGNITTTGKLDIGSSNTVNGTVKAASLNLRASGAVINGTTTISGDVDMESGTAINGDLKARDVITRSGNAVINGNAALNSIYIDWNNSVSGTITCTGALNGSEPCSCVSKPQSYNYTPRCGAATGNVPHHFQISHGGSALTCQPQTVTVTACANASCSAPHFTSSVNVTLTPGGKQFAVAGVNSAATVQSSSAGVYALSASAAGVTNSTTCVNTGAMVGSNACNMDFKTTGLKVTGSNHVSMTAGATVTIEALTAQAPNQSCVPLVSSKTVSIDMSCSYNDPVPAKAANVPIKLGSTTLACRGGTASVPFAFDANGKASVALEYAEVGQVGLKASYNTADFQAAGSGGFYAAPASLLLTATPPTPLLASKTAAIGPTPLDSKADALAVPFAKASQSFALKITAVNGKGTTTTNFGQEITPSLVNFVLDAVNPEGGGNSGVLTAGTFSGYTNGVASGTLSFSDVGVLRIKPKLASNYYMSQQDASFVTTGLQHIGRIIPDHFDTALLTNAQIDAMSPSPLRGRSMSCAPGGVALMPGINPCSAATNSFIHSSQPFIIKVSAYNGATPAAITANYDGALARAITLSAYTASGGATAADGAVSWSGAAPNFTFSSGLGNLASPAAALPNLPMFKFSKVYPELNVLPATIYLRASDADGATSLRTGAVEAPLTVVSGRLLIDNAHGSLTQALPINVMAQYYMPSGYVFNPQVNDTSVQTIASIISFSKCQNALDTGSGNCRAGLAASSSPDMLKLVNGKGMFRLAPPTPTLASPGSTEITLSKPGTPPTNLFPYLPSGNGRATFGIRSSPVIYTREVYN